MDRSNAGNSPARSENSFQSDKGDFDQVEEELFDVTAGKRGQPDTSPDGEGPKNLKIIRTNSDHSEIMPNLAVFVKGRNENISLMAKNKPLLFKRELTSQIGDISKLDIVGTSLKLTCNSINQKNHALKMTEIAGKLITVTEPFSNKQTTIGRNSTKIDMIKGIIFGVGLEETDEDLTLALDAIWARRHKRRNPTGVLENTTTVIFAKKGDTLPDTVAIGFFAKKVKPYIANPFRCQSCQIFGHKEGNCNSQAKCAQCGSTQHKYADCTNKDAPRCANCKGAHNAGYKGCPRYVEVQNALITASKEKITYSEAVAKNKETFKENTHIVQHQLMQIEENATDQTSNAHTYAENYPELGANQHASQASICPQQQKVGQQRYLQHSLRASDNQFQQAATIDSRHTRLTASRQTDDSNSYVQQAADSNNHATSIKHNTNIDIDFLIEEVVKLLESKFIERIESKFMNRLEQFFQQLIMQLSTSDINKETLDKVKESAHSFINSNKHTNNKNQE